MPDNEYVFFSLGLQSNGTCSSITSVNDSLTNNRVALTGGAIYSTDTLSLNVTCPSGQQLDLVSGCAAWTGNSVGHALTGTGTFAEGYGNYSHACCKGGQTK